VNQPEILFINNDFLILNKPAGWFSIPGRTPTPKDHVISEWVAKELKIEESDTTPFIVHRLDRYTSGIMLFAKNKEAHQQANAWFQNREVKKVYHFFASPTPTRPAIQIKTPIEGKAAQTLFEVIEKKENYFYGRATPQTGRFHQIREHARDAGFPILGDLPYGGAKSLKLSTGQAILFPRVCLHAYELTLPFGSFQAPLPADLVAYQEMRNA
jgi:23S rRNA-/tRNA-specific pseudouridylate synthase